MLGAVVILVAAASVLLLYLTTKPSRYNYRLTVEVDTPDGPRSGHSVHMLGSGRSIAILPGEARSASGIKGEAVAVELPNGQVLYALMRGEAATELQAVVHSAFDPEWRRTRFDESVKRVAAEFPVGEERELGGQNPGGMPGESGLPMLVTFRHTGDPKSVEHVDPADLAASFGPGYALRRITVQITTEPVTAGIKKRLAWLKDPGLTLDPGAGPTVQPTFAQTIRQSAFWQGNS
jgi:hypothetical protein